MEGARDRIESVSFRSSTEVINTYQFLFPRSVLPRFCRFAFWAFICVAAIVLGAVMLKSIQLSAVAHNWVLSEIDACFRQLSIHVLSVVDGLTQ